MSHTFTPTAVAPPATYTHPSDGDKITASSVDPTFESLGNGLKWVSENNRPSTNVGRVLAWNAVYLSGFAMNSDARAQNAATGGIVIHELDLPEGATLTAVYVIIYPAGGHAGLPGTMPKIAVYHGSMTADSFTQVGSDQSDTSANTTAYQLVHNISLTGLSHVVSRSARRYTVRLDGEAGANSLGGLRMFGVAVDLTITKEDIGAA